MDFSKAKIKIQSQSDRKLQANSISLSQTKNNVASKNLSVSNKNQETTALKKMEQTKAFSANNNLKQTTSNKQGYQQFSKTKTVSPFQLGGQSNFSNKTIKQIGTAQLQSKQPHAFLPEKDGINPQWEFQQYLNSSKRINFEQLTIKLASMNTIYADLFNKIAISYTLHKKQSQKLSNTKNEQYSLKCMKYLQDNQRLMTNIQQNKVYKHNWSILQQFVKQHNQQHSGFQPSQNIHDVSQLIELYCDTEQILFRKQTEYGQLLNKNIASLQNRQPEQTSHDTNKLQKTYKKLQRKLLSQSQQTNYYQKKAKQYQNKLDDIERMILNAQTTKSELQMRVIHQSGRKQKRTRSQLKKQHKMNKINKKQQEESKNKSVSNINNTKLK